MKVTSVHCTPTENTDDVACNRLTGGYFDAEGEDGEHGLENEGEEELPHG